MNATTFGRMGLGLILGVSIAACTPGGVGNVDNGDFRRIASSEPGVDDRLDALGIICESTLTVTGTYTETTPRPPDNQGTGCWDVGTWVVKAVVDFQGCDPLVPLEAEYVYEVTRDEEDQTNIEYMGEFDPERMNLKVTSAGDGLCHGGFEHFRADGVVFTFQPVKQNDGTLIGIGSVAVWEEDPF